MNIKLLNYTPLAIADTAIGKCWDTGCIVDVDDMRDRIFRVANKSGHTSTIEHLYYSFDIDGISRAVLQELSRHRIASYTVKSSRFTLKKDLKNEHPFNYKDYDRAVKYVKLTGDGDVDQASIKALENVRQLVKANKSNDVIKYALPESFKTSLVFSINARSLQNFLRLRTHKNALQEIRDLGYGIYKVLPESHKYLYEECCVYSETKKEKLKRVEQKIMHLLRLDLVSGSEDDQNRQARILELIDEKVGLLR